MSPDPLAEKTARLRALRLAREADKPRSRRVIERLYPVIGVDDELTFGKHKGKLLGEVIEHDPAWIKWAIENIATFEVSDEALAALE